MNTDLFRPTSWTILKLAERFRDYLMENHPSERSNIYNDLCRAIAKNEFDGTLEQMRLVASGYIKIQNIGAKKRLIIQQFINRLDQENNLDSLLNVNRELLEVLRRPDPETLVRTLKIIQLPQTDLETAKVLAETALTEYELNQRNTIQDG